MVILSKRRRKQIKYLSYGILIFFIWIISRFIPVLIMSKFVNEQIHGYILFAVYAICGIYINYKIYEREQGLALIRVTQRKYKTWQIIALSILILCTIDISIMLLGNIQQTKVTITIALYTLIIAPLTEEIVYRELIFNWLSKYNLIFAFVLEVILFTSIHLPNTILGIIHACIGAIILTFVYYYTQRNLWCSYLVHMVNNLIVVIPLIKI